MTERRIISLGGACDVALEMLRPNGRMDRTHFFDWAWNQDQGLELVKTIIESDFEGFDSLNQFVLTEHPAWNFDRENEEPLMILSSRKYPSLAFPHNRRNEGFLRSLNRKTERFRALLKIDSQLEFVYYRLYSAPVDGQYDGQVTIHRCLRKLEEECSQFAEFMSAAFPQLRFHLWGVISGPTSPEPEVESAINAFVRQEPGTARVTYAHVKRRGFGSRSSWKALLHAIDNAPRWTSPTIAIREFADCSGD